MIDVGGGCLDIPAVETAGFKMIDVGSSRHQLFVKNGARIANPGEYTLRAFLNGKLDLSQAALAELLGNDAQSVALWEKGKVRVPAWADRLMRALYREHTKGNVRIRSLIETVSQLENKTRAATRLENGPTAGQGEVVSNPNRGPTSGGSRHLRAGAGDRSRGHSAMSTRSSASINATLLAAGALLLAGTVQADEPSLLAA